MRYLCIHYNRVTCDCLTLFYSIYICTIVVGPNILGSDYQLFVEKSRTTWVVAQYMDWSVLLLVLHVLCYVSFVKFRQKFASVNSTYCTPCISEDESYILMHLRLFTHR